jgi:hypothetical protein
MIEEGKIRLPVFKLACEGQSLNGWKLRGQSRLVYLDKQLAASDVETFEAKWYDQEQLECAVPGTLKTVIVEHELVVSRHTLERLLRENPA